MTSQKRGPNTQVGPKPLHKQFSFASSAGHQGEDPGQAAEKKYRCSRLPAV